MTRPSDSHEERPPRDVAALRDKSIRGGALTAASQGGTVLIQLSSAVVLARLLGPKEFGIIAMVVAVTAFAGIFRDLGLSAPTIQNDDLTEDQLSWLFWVNLAAGTALTVAVALCSPLVAWFYGREELVWITIALSPVFLVGSFGAQSAALLIRDMRFGRLAIANVSGPLLTFVTAALFALSGFSYWALVIGSLAGVLLKSVLYFVLAGSRLRIPKSKEGIRDLLAFGGNVTAFDVINYFARNADNLLIGRYWGDVSLGLYNRAYQLLMFPITNIRGPINSVAFPALSRLKYDAHEYRRYYRGVTSILALLSMPLTACLFVTSHLVISVLLGKDWLEAVPIYSTLALVAFIQPCGSTIGLVCLSRGLGRRFLATGTAGAVLAVTGFAVGIQWGPVGVAWGYVASTYIGVLPITYYAFRSTPLKLRHFLADMARPAIASVVAGTVLYWLLPELPALPDLATLCIAGSLFMVTYFLLIAVQPGGRSDLRRLQRLVKAVWPRKRAVALDLEPTK